VAIVQIMAVYIVTTDIRTTGTAMAVVVTIMTMLKIIWRRETTEDRLVGREDRSDGKTDQTDQGAEWDVPPEYREAVAAVAVASVLSRIKCPKGAPQMAHRRVAALDKGLNIACELRLA